MTFRQTEVDSLAAKLDALGLTAGERAALEALFDAAEAHQAETSGFALDRPNVANPYANQEVSYFRPRLMTILGTYIGETEKNLG